MAITFNIIERTFWIKAFDQEAFGTAFAIERNGKYFLVSAKHIFEGSRLDKISVFKDDKWSTISVVARQADSEVDLVAFEVSQPFWPLYDIRLAEGAIMMGEDIFALGFPLSLSMALPREWSSFPGCFAAKGCIAAVRGAGREERKRLYLSMPLDKGYSGGPVVLAREMTVAPVIVGVVSHNLRYREQVSSTGEGTVKVFNPANLVVCETWVETRKLLS